MVRKWRVIRRIWATAGSIVMVGFVGWSFLAYRATDEATNALLGDARVEVTRREGYWWFAKRADTQAGTVGLLVFPGALVDPVGYAPLARAVAAAGFPVLLVELPWRGAFFAADGAAAIKRARKAMQEASTVAHWVIAGHSRGAVVAALMLRDHEREVSGLVLIGTTHPRDFSLAHVTVPVTKVVGTRDCIAAIRKSEGNRHLLPAATRWMVIEGGNHSQFGWYGFQPGDCFATIDRDRQQQLTIRAVLDALETVEGLFGAKSLTLYQALTPPLVRPQSAALPREVINRTALVPTWSFCRGGKRHSRVANLSGARASMST